MWRRVAMAARERPRVAMAARVAACSHGCDCSMAHDAAMWRCMAMTASV
jgi:hypothetical protein